MELEDQLNKEAIPKHIAIIMDGNGRWAKERGKARIFGHRNALEAVQETTETAAKIGVKHVTLYAFSTENWNRPQREVNALMELLVNTINKEIKNLQKNNIKLTAIGDLKSLPSATRRELAKAIEATKNNTQLEVILALSYSSRWEIVEGIKKLCQGVKNGEVDIDTINEETFSSYLATNNVPDPELMIRTSGEMRISNFLLWQLAYAELIFTPKLWPDFRGPDLIQAVIDFQKRERRFGMTSEQVKA
ncbi:isoprenyl transferase [Salibacteraceae bacterium]|jgi:undecaprenyl diphosphate synthase|nr:isoprenyl transferase [Salibacteraceae bacterium]MDB9708324.1 isoprenyl transferase [Salibacteraceae bacterium]